MILRSLLLVAFVLVAIAAPAGQHTKDSLDTVRKNLAERKAVLIDVREPAEWKRGHLEQAELVPLSELRRLKDDLQAQQALQQKLPQDKIVYCHCASGVRVLTAASVLGKLGYDVRPLAAGFDDLREAGFPTASDK